MARRKQLRERRRVQEEARAAARGDFSHAWQRKGIVYAVAIEIAALVLFVSPDGFDAFQPPKAIAAEVSSFVLLVLLGLTLIRYGIHVLPRTRLHLFVGTFLAANVLATIFAEDRYTALFGDATRLEGLTFLVEMVVLYVAVTVAFRSTADWIDLGYAVFAATTLALLYALIQYSGHDPYHWAGDPKSRPFATFGNSDIFAHFLSLAAGATVGVILFWQRPPRLAAAAMLVAIVAVGALTATRGFLLGLAGVAVIAAILAVRAYGSAKLPWRYVALGGVTGVAALAAILFATPLGTRAIGTFTGGALLSDRLVIYRTALEAFAARPLWGWGVDNFEAASVPHRQLDSVTVFGPQGWLTSAHDWPFQVITTTGLLGILSLAALIAVATIEWWSRALPRARAIAAPLGLAFVGYSTHALVSVGSVSVDWLPWLFFGGVAALTADALPSLGSRTNPGLAWSVAAVMAVVAALILTVPAYAANDEAGKAVRASDSGQRAKAVEFARAAVANDDGRARYWDRYGKVLAAADQNRDAGDAFAEAAERVPYHFEYWNNLAVTRALQAQAGDQSRGGWSAALAAVRAGLDRDRNNTVLLYTLAYIQDGMGDGAGALASAARAISLYSREPSYDVMAAQASGHVSDAATAAGTLEALLRTKDSAILRIAAARAEIRAGSRDAAVTNLRHVIEVLDPTNREAADLLRSLGVAR